MSSKRRLRRRQCEGKRSHSFHAEVLGSRDPAKVTCKACRRTVAWKKASDPNR